MLNILSLPAGVAVAVLLQAIATEAEAAALVDFRLQVALQ